MSTPVTLVKDEVLALPEAHPNFFQVVEEAAGGRHNDVGVVCESRELLFHAVAADEETEAEVCELAEFLGELERLQCEFARR